MKGIFSLDSKFMQGLSRFGDILILNVIYLLTCIPVVTIGAATNALYSVCFKMGTDEEGSLYKRYFRVFAADFKQATILWLILFVLGFSSVYYFFLFFSASGALRYLCIPALIVFLGTAFTFGYAFPLLSQFENRTMSVLRNALLLSIGYLPRSLVIAVVDLLPLALFFFAPYTFLRVGFVWFTVYFSAAAWLNAHLLRGVFRRLYPQNEPCQA